MKIYLVIHDGYEQSTVGAYTTEELANLIAGERPNRHVESVELHGQYTYSASELMALGKVTLNP